MYGSQIIQVASTPINGGFKIIAPISGESSGIAMSSLSIARRRLLGDGVVLALSGSFIVAPFDGIIESINPQGTSIVFKANNSLKVALTLGAPEQQLIGYCLRFQVQVGAPITQGQRIAELDISKYNQLDQNAAITFPGAFPKAEIFHHFQKFIAGEDPLFVVKVKKTWT